MKKLAIVGSGPNTRDKAPWEDKTFDIWVFNEAAMSEWCKRWDACFQMHKPEVYTGANLRHPGHWEWLQQPHGKAIYMQARDERVPDSVEYPLQDAINLVGLKYLEATICDALAMAVLLGYGQIDIYGVEFSATEYKYQAECYRFWVGYCMGRGITVNLQSGAHLFDALLYGYEGSFTFGAAYFRERANYHAAEWNAAEKNVKGTLNAIARLLEKGEALKVMGLIANVQQSAMKSGQSAGAMGEAEKYLPNAENFVDRGIFETAAAQAQTDGEAKRVEMHRLTGQIEYVWNVWNQTKDARARAQLAGTISRLAGLAYDVGALHGAYSENIAYILKCDEVRQANGAWQPPASIATKVYA